MYDLSGDAETMAVSVMREGDAVCVSYYSRLPLGKLGEVLYLAIVEEAMRAAAEFECGLIIQGSENEEG